MLIFIQKQALLWCIERENPVPPTSEADHPVQFWQLKKADGKVSDMLFFFSLASVHTLFTDILLQSCVITFFSFPQLLTLFLVATKTPQETPPKLGRGALCADSMGLYVSGFSTPAYAKRPEGGKLSQ